jgi:RNA polymerase sigma-70 factor (ECF subfamily)
MPIGMYTILIGTFFILYMSDVVLIRQFKTHLMKTKVTNSEVSYQNLHQNLIDGCKKGDQKAQFQIYKLYYKAMYNASLQIVRNSMEAEDIMQESFLSAFEAIGNYSGTVSFGAWLKRIVLNRSYDYLRKNCRMVFEELEHFHELAADASENLFEKEETDRLAGRIKEAIKQLPSKCRNVLSLHLLEGYDHDEIGLIMSISSSTSRSQYSRARFRLISELENKYPA